MPTSGMTTSPRWLPFHCISRGELPVRNRMTAHALAVDVEATASTAMMRCSSVVGSCVRVHAVPSQCKTSRPRPVKPTARASVAEVAAISSRALL
jgi:hypothetical protein